jgi:UDP-N-acetylmuramate--alanine ligase
VRTFGIKSQADTRADNIIPDGTATDFDLYYHDYRLGHIHLPLPGVFNVKNALAAISVALEFDIPFETIKKALASFKGVNRRFDLIGEQNGGFYDDHAHHPPEIDVTLRAKVAFKSRVIVVFNRTCLAAHAISIRNSKSLLMVIRDPRQIYPAREEPIAGDFTNDLRCGRVVRPQERSPYRGHNQINQIS